MHMVAHASVSRRSDSFYYVGEEMILHNKANYAYSANQ